MDGAETTVLQGKHGPAEALAVHGNLCVVAVCGRPRVGACGGGCRGPARA
jgi:hypothetical protein